MKTRITWLLLGIAIMLQAIPVRAQPPEEKKLAALSDIRRELACYCSCSLTVEDCLRSMRCSESTKLSEEVTTMFDAGKNKADILHDMVAKYSETILSAPTKKGFNLLAWILPFAMIGIGGIAAALVIRKWRSQSSPVTVRPSANTTSETADPYARQLEEELKKLAR